MPLLRLMAEVHACLPNPCPPGMGPKQLTNCSGTCRAPLTSWVTNDWCPVLASAHPWWRPTPPQHHLPWAVRYSIFPSPSSSTSFASLRPPNTGVLHRSHAGTRRRPRHVRAWSPAARSQLAPYGSSHGRVRGQARARERCALARTRFPPRVASLHAAPCPPLPPPDACAL
jgi:hypothetical protein